MQRIKMFWWKVPPVKNRLANAGDVFGPYIFDKLKIEYELSNAPDIITCGSILERANKNTLVWGSGLHNKTDRLNLDPKNVLAVRGKLTCKYAHLDESKAIGDPGTLLSYFYQPKKDKKYKFGIIAHYVDEEEFKKVQSDNILVISMLSPIEEIADKISQCEFIFSSSLHGIIFSHSLGVPAVHIINKPLYSLDNFKFKDYYSMFGSIEYINEKWDPSLKFVDKYLKEPEKYAPKKEEIEIIQENLLNCFPYKNE